MSEAYVRLMESQKLGGIMKNSLWDTPSVAAAVAMLWDLSDVEHLYRLYGEDAQEDGSDS